ncbi:MAG TPA: ribonuclease Y [Candidatus Dormibacteraeota bacterium]|nr:ribonuclease Y [Candidatus Dormibacteraeota bacterium]
MPIPFLLVGVVVGAALGALVAYLWIGNANRQRDITSNAEREKLLADAETQMKEMVLEAKEEAHRVRMSLEQEVRDARAETQRSERRVQQKEESIDRKLEDLDRKEQAVNAKELEIGRTRERVNDALAQQVKELERISSMTRAEARTVILGNLEKELSQEIAQKIRAGEETVREESEKRARNILVTAMQRVAAEQTAETSVSVVAIPSDEMKGRIIGREGRNIRALEHATGVDLIIDDTPEAVILSGFDPVRREVARVALNHLLVDGRIHPARIEEMVQKARGDVQNRIREEGEQAMFETGVTGLHPELVKLLGTLAFRTSYGQNVLTHSKEVSFLAGMVASEIGADVPMAREAGLLHDIGKAVDHEVEGSHAIIGGELLKRLGKPDLLVNAVAAHHMDVDPTSLEAVLTIACDAVSAARPGARRETLTTYIKRLEKLESIANDFEGVEKSFAIQAGREIRIIVKPETIDDSRAQILARDIAKRIEGELSYPGQIKVTVIRETRIVEFAK